MLCAPVFIFMALFVVGMLHLLIGEILDDKFEGTPRHYLLTGGVVVYFAAGALLCIL